MKRFALRVLVLAMVVTLSGCVTVSTYEKERVDQELKGNRGALEGASQSTKEGMGPTRTMIKWDIELPEPIDLSRLKAGKTPDETLEGNIGVMKKGVTISTGAAEKKEIIETEEKISPTEGEIKTGGKPFRWFMPAPKTREWEEKVEVSKEAGPKATFKLFSAEAEPAQKVAEGQKAIEKKEVFDYYTVRKNQTLGDIAALPEVYGTSRKWKKIYEANKDIIKDPNKIFPGQKLKIPRDEPVKRLK